MEEAQQHQLQHFMHKHPLRLVSVEKEGVFNWQQILCYACQKPISAGGSAYTCANKCCILFLHKACAEAPREVEHRMHSQHPLVLSSNPPYQGYTCECNVCKITGWKWFTYRCDRCYFDVHISCVMDETTAMTNEVIHNHPLTFVQRQASFSCDLCGTEDRDFSYRCNTCQFWVHKACAPLQGTIIHHTHDHPLVFSSSLPDAYHRFGFRCEICRGFLNPFFGLFRCDPCRYFIHLKCATSEPNSLTLRCEESGVQDDKDDKDFYPDLMHFPVKDGPVDLISQFVKVLTSNDDVNKQETSTLDHFSHEHPLTLSDSATHMNMDGVRCNGCLRPISAPFYSCGSCSFFLHVHCTKLPSEWQHPCHPVHVLELYELPLSRINYFTCNACGMNRNGLFYRCVHCNFYIDVECACLRSTIKHKSHKRPLKIQSRGKNRKCNACANNIPDIRMGCQTCGFKLHYQCAMLPETVSHEWERHPLYLIYSSSCLDDPVDTFCEICEEDIKPKLWLYHCRVCSQSFHPQCVLEMASY